jgi:hypothetical protein
MSRASNSGKDWRKLAWRRTVLGDRDSKEFTVYSALDQAFANRVSRCFDSLCDSFEDDQATTLFLQRFKTATDMWNAARAAIEAEFPRDP